MVEIDICYLTIAVAEKILNLCVVESATESKAKRREHYYSVLYNYEFIEDLSEEPEESG